MPGMREGLFSHDADVLLLQWAGRNVDDRMRKR